MHARGLDGVKRDERILLEILREKDGQRVVRVQGHAAPHTIYFREVVEGGRHIFMQAKTEEVFQRGGRIHEDFYGTAEHAHQMLAIGVLRQKAYLTGLLRHRYFYFGEKIIISFKAERDRMAAPFQPLQQGLQSQAVRRPRMVFAHGHKQRLSFGKGFQLCFDHIDDGVRGALDVAEFRKFYFAGRIFYSARHGKGRRKARDKLAPRQTARSVFGSLSHTLLNPTQSLSKIQLFIYVKIKNGPRRVRF